MKRTFDRRVYQVLFLGTVCVVAVGLAMVSPRTARAAAPNFTLTGAGWGHGIGLSQYGAKGWAEQGKTGSWIASYYYPGTTVGTLPSKSVDVNIDNNADYDGTGDNDGYAHTSWTIRPGYVNAQLGLSGSSSVTLLDANGPYLVQGAGSTIVVKDKSGKAVTGSPFAGTLTITPKGGSSPQLTQIQTVSGAYDHSGVRYRGTMLLTASLGRVRLINRLSQDDYLYGVVPRESPASWPIESLKAQAIVARSYAYPAGVKYCTTRSQVYNGHSRGDRVNPTMHEAASSNNAVAATSGQCVLYQGAVVKTYFHSTSGGYTANIEDVWLGATPSSYYRGVPDPYCGSVYNPWTPPVSLTGLSMASKLAAAISGEPAGAGSTVWVKSLGLERAYPSGFVRRVDVMWSNGTVTRGLSGDTFRSALGLKSTKFFVNSPFDRVALGDRYGTAVKISESAFATSGSAKAVVLVNGTDAKFPDALTGSALAGLVSGPVLMTPMSSLPQDVDTELKRLRALGCAKVYIVGGAESISAPVALRAEAIMGSVERLAGNERYGVDRYGTAATVAMKMKELGASGKKVLVASGEDWPDAAVASAIAAGTHRPVVLTGSRSLPKGSRLVLGDLGATESVLFGGAKAITAPALASVLSATGETSPAKRFGTLGSRYDTGVEAAKWAVSSLGFTLSTVYIASGERFPDSVTGGLMAGRGMHPLLMTASRAASGPTAAYLAANHAVISSVVVVGGVSVIPDAVASTLASYAY